MQNSNNFSRTRGGKGIALKVKGPKKAKRRLNTYTNTDGVWPALFMDTVMKEEHLRRKSPRRNKEQDESSPLDEQLLGYSKVNMFNQNLGLVYLSVGWLLNVRNEEYVMY